MVIAIVLASLADVIKSQTIMIQIFLDTLSRKKERRRTTGMEKLGAMGEVRIVQMGKIVKMNNIASTRFFESIFFKTAEQTSTSP